MANYLYFINLSREQRIAFARLKPHIGDMQAEGARFASRFLEDLLKSLIMKEVDALFTKRSIHALYNAMCHSFFGSVELHSGPHRESFLALLEKMHPDRWVATEAVPST